MQPHEQRVVAERDDLKERFEKLEAFLDGDIFRNMTVRDRTLLRRQYGHMEGYLKMLDLRIKYFTP